MSGLGSNHLECLMWQLKAESARQYEEGSSVLCALCLHPIGYYGDTWAGVMCPTDEVILYLLMKRGSEEKYWANANQHPVGHSAAGF